MLAASADDITNPTEHATSRRAITASTGRRAATESFGAITASTIAPKQHQHHRQRWVRADARDET